VSGLVRSGTPEGRGLDDLQRQTKQLEELLATRGDEVARVRGDLDAFKISYRQQVGLLHEELDELERAISEAELGELARRREEQGPGPGTAPPRPRAERLPRFTTDAVRALFRDVAKAIHPDLARDAHTRDRRHALMVEANKAYASGDEERLRSILQAWERSPDAVQGNDLEATRLRLARRIAEIEDQLVALDGEMSELKDSPLWKLKAMVDDASSRGKDLVGDMVRRLKRDILAARNRLEAIRS
jgi:hypothetical protein